MVKPREPDWFCLRRKAAGKIEELKNSTDLFNISLKALIKKKCLDCDNPNPFVSLAALSKITTKH